MRKRRPALFKGRHFEAEIIVVCVRWYLRYALSYRDLEELMAERNLRVDYSAPKSKMASPRARDKFTPLGERASIFSE